MRKLPTILLLVCMAAACSRTPDYVIPESKMAQLLADIYIGDAVVESETKLFANDSMRKLLTQSIYARHGVTREQFDTSLIWYGHNLQAYMDVSKQTEEILQKRIEDAERAGGKAERAPRQISIDGDSVNIWTGIKYRRNTQSLPSEYISFSISTDKNWERGDRYTLSAKGLNTRRMITMNMAVDYNDGTTEYRWYAGPAEGMNRLLLVLDSAKVASSLYGVIHYQPASDEVSYLDSISLVRTRGRNDNVMAREGQTTVRNR